MAQRTTRQWIINGVLIVITLTFTGISIAPLLAGILAPSPAPDAASNGSGQPTSERERLKIQIEGFEAVLKREPNNQTALAGLTDLKLQLGDIEGAVAPLETLATLNPSKPEYRLILARTKLQLKDRDGAIAEYRTILASKPGNIQALQSLVTLELQDNRPEAAIGLLQETLNAADKANKIEPNSVDKNAVLWILGELYRTQGRNSEAIATYDQIAKANAKDFRPLVGKAQILRAQGKETEAKTLFAEAAKLAPAEYRDRVNELAAQAAPAPSGVPPAVPGSTPAPTGTSGTAPAASPAPAAPNPQ